VIVVLCVSKCKKMLLKGQVFENRKENVYQAVSHCKDRMYLDVIQNDSTSVHIGSNNDLRKLAQDEELYPKTCGSRTIRHSGCHCSDSKDNEKGRMSESEANVVRKANCRVLPLPNPRREKKTLVSDLRSMQRLSLTLM
jgi:hypothetical protein